MRALVSMAVAALIVGARSAAAADERPWSVGASTYAYFVSHAPVAGELGIYPLPWLRVGVVIQRSLVFQNDLDVQRGLLVSGTYRFVTLTLYELNLLWTTATWVLAMAVSF